MLFSKEKSQGLSNKNYLTSIVTAWMIAITFRFGDFITFFRIVKMITWWWCWWLWWTVHRQISSGTFNWDIMWFFSFCYRKLEKKQFTYRRYDGRLSYANHSDHKVRHNCRRIEIHTGHLQGRSWLDHRIQDHHRTTSRLESWRECIDAANGFFLFHY